MVSEAINRVNDAMLFGSFEKDMKDGEIRVRAALESDAFVASK